MAGQFCITPGSALNVGDYVFDRVTQRWYKLHRQSAKTRSARGFLGIDKQGGRRALLLDSSNVKAWRAHR